MGVANNHGTKMATNKRPKPLHLANSMKELNSKTTSQKPQTTNPKL